MAARLGRNQPRSHLGLHLRGPRGNLRRFLNWKALPASAKRLGEMARQAVNRLFGAAVAGLILAAVPVWAGERVAAGERGSAKASAIADAPAKAREPSVYAQAEILAPVKDAALRDNAGRVQVSGRVQPPLAPGHQVQLLLDGAPWGSPQSTANFSLSNIDRGTHSLRLRILNGKGKPLFTGPPSTFHLLRHSRLHPKPGAS